MGQILCCTDGDGDETRRKEGIVTNYESSSVPSDDVVSANNSSSSGRAHRSKSATYRLKKDRIETHARARGIHTQISETFLEDEDWNNEDTMEVGGDSERLTDKGGPSSSSLPPTTTSAQEKTPDEINFIDESLTDASDEFIFGALSDSERREIIDAMELICYLPDRMIIRQGDVGDYFYVVKEGTIAIHIKEEEEKISHEQEEKEDVSNTKSVIHLNPANELWDPLCGTKDDLFVGYAPDSGSGKQSEKKGPWVTMTMRGEDVIRRFSNRVGLKSSVLERPGGGVANKATPQRRAEFIQQSSKSPKGETAVPAEAIKFSVIRKSHPYRHVGTFGPGDTFGELALLYNTPRMATCVAQTRCTLWRVDSHTFRHVLAGHRSKSASDNEPTEHQMAMECLKKIKLFADLDDTVLNKIADDLVPVAFSKGERIINKGDVGDVFHIIKSGKVKIHDIGFGDSQFCDAYEGPGDWFGEHALMTGERRSANVTAVSETVVTLALSREEFELRLGRLQDMIDMALRKKHLLSIPLIYDSELEPHELDALSQLPTKITFQTGDRIKNELQPALYIIDSGAIQISDEERNAVNILRKGDHFGGYLLMDNARGKAIEVNEETVCWMLTKDAIESVIGTVSRLGKPQPNVFAKLDKTITLQVLTRHRILGVGSFGKVWLVQHKKKQKSVYALKTMAKKDVIKGHAARFVLREKNIMASIDHPFIVDLISVFQDEHFLYMVESFVQGGELFTVIHRRSSNGVSNDAARFYAACIWESLSHLHRRNICYRDLKPENVLIDGDGYGILADLGFAKVVLDKTFTKCGTPEYFAPELVLGRGHNKGVDNWAFGCVVYEMIVGQSPFDHVNATPMSLFRRIIQLQYAFPNMEEHGIHVTPEAQDIIRRLLNGDPRNRLGSLVNGDRDVRSHPWFAGILDGMDLLSKKVKAPWVPRISDPTDTSHFENYTDVENRERGRRYEKLTNEEQGLFREF